MTEQRGTASATRHQQRIDDLCAATLRALGDAPELHFRGRRLHQGERALPSFAPHLQPTPGVDDFASFRGAADGMALRLQHSDAALHQRLLPEAPVERLLYNMLEQFRVESLAPAHMPGMVYNLRHRFEAWSTAFYASGLTESAKGILLYTVAQITRSRVTAQPVSEATEDAIESTRMAIVKPLGHGLAGLRRHRHDQRAYATHALSIAQQVATMLKDCEAHSAADADESEADQASSAFTLWLDVEGEGSDHGLPTAAHGTSRLLTDPQDAYRVFTTEFDTEDKATSLVRAALLDEYRERIDHLIERQGLSVSRLARQLLAVLAHPERDGWATGLEEGHIDGRQLHRLITSPDERRLFKQERFAPVADCMVSFLIDCSGSMREHIDHVAVLVDVMARALDQIGVATEVLGFTTNAWNGGRAQKAWRRAGRPAHPGRLNETCHLVFKDSTTPWRRARPALGALLKSDLFREGVDGEALIWAAQRLVQRHEGRGRKLLLVVSDGSPTDGATALANDEHYLDHHLCDVVGHLHRQQQVEVFGVGVGLDLSPYYRRNCALDLSAGVNNQVLAEIATMLVTQSGRTAKV